jgi:hypothetical protein
MSRDTTVDDESEEWLDDQPENFEIDNSGDDDSDGEFMQDGPAVDPYADDDDSE